MHSEPNTATSSLVRITSEAFVTVTCIARKYVFTEEMGETVTPVELNRDFGAKPKLMEHTVQHRVEIEEEWKSESSWFKRTRGVPNIVIFQPVLLLMLSLKLLCSITGQVCLLTWERTKMLWISSTCRSCMLTCRYPMTGKRENTSGKR